MKQAFQTASIANSNWPLKLADTLIIVICSVLMYRIRNGFWLPSGDYQLLMIVIIFVTLNIFSWADIYRQNRGRWLYRRLTSLTIAWGVVALCLGVITFFTKSGETFSRLWVIMTFVSSYFLMIFLRLYIWNRERQQRMSGQSLRPTVIIGAGELGRRACAAMLEERWAGLQPIAIFDDAPELLGKSINGVEVKGSIADAIEFIEQQRQIAERPVKEAWIALPLSAKERIQSVQNALQNTATHVYLMPDIFGINLASYRLEESAGLPVINMSASAMTESYARLKRAEDLIVAAVMLAVLSPFMLITALLIKGESSGSALFKQRRYGLDGKEILVWKFRSMTVREDDDNVTQATQNDQRVTRVGAFIRKYSIDELPQLINVLNGTMSLVGPRPHAVAHNEYYRDKVHGYMARHKIRPGITGWAQINGCRGETDVIEKMQRRLRYDLEYIQNWSIALDVRILLKTLYTVLRDKNAY